MNLRTFLFALLFFSFTVSGGYAGNESRFSFQQEKGKLMVKIDGRVMATYVYDDPKILRPYFANLKAPGGIQVTRNHPPLKGIDSDDHSTMHPGLWLAFGDISGSDFWRNKASAEHVGFLTKPHTGKNLAGFTVKNRYLAPVLSAKAETGGDEICRETCRITIMVRPSGYLIIWDSAFSSDKRSFYFGDQEEMGLGVRLATPITVKSGKGGRIIDDQGRINEKQIWGKETLWCDYSGPIEGQFVGVTIMPDPDNFRPCRWHVRNYGFMTANPFGWKAFKQADSSKIRVAKGQEFRLRYGILLHCGADSDSPDLKAAYRDYLNISRKSGSPR